MNAINSNQHSAISSLILIFATVLVTLGLLAIGAFGFWFYQEKFIKKAEVSPSPSVIPQASLLVSPQVIPSPTAKPSPVASVQTRSDLEQLKEAMARKHSKTVAEVNLTISKNTGTYANGSVTFTGEIGGGWWLGYNDGSQWLIVADGNGTMMCADIQPYNFPVDMIPECWDEATNKLIKR